jgi:hypothetical protein
MTMETFFTLRDWLLANTSLKSSREKAGISIEDSVGSSIKSVNTPCVNILENTQRAAQLHTVLYQESRQTSHTYTVQTRCVKCILPV